MTVDLFPETPTTGPPRISENLSFARAASNAQINDLGSVLSLVEMMLVVYMTEKLLAERFGRIK